MEKEKKETLFILFIGLLFIMVLSTMFVLFNSSNVDRNKVFYEINNTKTGIHPQSISYENFKYGNLERIKNDNLSKKYVPTCEKELTNKFLTNKESIPCMNTYLTAVNKSTTFGEIDMLRTNLLSCLKDDNLKHALQINFRGIDIILMDLMYYPTYCQENKDIFYGASVMLLALFGFMLSFIIYLFTGSGLILFLGTGLSAFSLFASIIYKLFF